MRTYIFRLFLIAVWFNAHAQQEVARVDITKSRTVGFDDFVENITYIRLKSPDVANFDQVISSQVYKEYLYIMGRTIAGNKLVIYKTTGELVKEILFDDALLVNSFTVVPALNQLWVVSRFKVLNKYSLNGSLVKRVSLPFPCANLYAVDKENFLVYSGDGRKNIEDHLLALTDFKSIHQLFIQSLNLEAYPFTPQSMFADDGSGNRLLILPRHSDTLYTYLPTHKTVVPFCILDFGGALLTRKRVPKGGFSDKEMDDIITGRKYIYSITSFYQASGRLFFKMLGKREDFCAVNLNDLTSVSFAALFDNYLPTSYNPWVGSDGTHLFFAVRESRLADYYKKNPCSYPALRKLLPTLSNSSNGWLLLRIQIKKTV